MSVPRFGVISKVELTGVFLERVSHEVNDVAIERVCLGWRGGVISKVEMTLSILGEDMS